MTVVQEITIECDACKAEVHGPFMRNGVMVRPEGWVFVEHYETIDKVLVLNAVASLVTQPKHFCSNACHAASEPAATAEGQVRTAAQRLR